ncbi:MAG: UDP-N-acetylglucosamine--N-acetylmuramyl-(pentapeptide) pyrophosphoryl-undecaprenol N-acetylglucosamine transferase [Pseudomonadota bacterium]
MPDPAPENPLLIIGAGGTGGHMFPAAAFAAEMGSRGWSVGLVSDSRGLRYAETFPADWKEEVQAASPNIRKPWTLPVTAWKLSRGAARADQLISELKPALIAGFGGYPAFPLMSAARRKGAPILIHEQNAVLGRVNRQFAKAASVVASGFPRLDRLPDGVVHKPIGNPVRVPIAEQHGSPFPSTDGPLTIFITGGSQGARILGEALPDAIANHLSEDLKSRLRIVQQVREEQTEKVRAVYSTAGIEAELQTFFSDMPERLAAAHLVIARSGAGTVSEIAAIGRPSILIPLKIAMDDHQTANAGALVDVGAADILSEDALTPAAAGELISRRLSDVDDLRARAAAARSAGTVSAAKDLADLAESIAGK